MFNASIAPIFFQEASAPLCSMRYMVQLLGCPKIIAGFGIPSFFDSEDPQASGQTLSFHHTKWASCFMLVLKFQQHPPTVYHKSQLTCLANYPLGKPEGCLMRHRADPCVQWCGCLESSPSHKNPKRIEVGKFPRKKNGDFWRFYQFGDYSRLLFLGLYGEVQHALFY